MTEIYLETFAREQKNLPGANLEWLSRQRREALDRFAASGFPSVLSPIAKASFEYSFSSSPKASEETLNELPASWQKFPRATFVNGRFDPRLSPSTNLPHGLRLSSLAEAWAKAPKLLEQYFDQIPALRHHPLAALNTAFAADGAVIQVEKNVTVTEPLLLIYTTGTGPEKIVTYPRTLIVAEEGSRLTVVELYLGGSPAHWSNAVTELHLAANANIEHVKLQIESTNSYHVGSVHARQEKNSRLVSHSFSFGAALSRHDISTELAAEGGECALNGLYMVSGNQHVDHHTTIDHAKPHCTSRELYKGVLGGASRGVFNGKIIVRPDAQKTDAVQYNRNLILSSDALVETTPQLEIFANDVKCAHGATIGQLAEEQLFYVRSRGLSQMDARHLLIQAFVQEMVTHVSNTSLHDGLGALLTPRTPQ